MRADAVRNRARVLEAAEEAFACDGVRAQIEDVAKRAGVGVGTVCRHFPTKEALLAAVVEVRLEALIGDADRALAVDDPGEGFRRFFEATADFLATHKALAEQLAASPELIQVDQELKDRYHAKVTAIVSRAQSAGALRPDVGPTDVTLLLSGVAHAIAVHGDLGPVVRNRYLGVLLDGLLTTQPTPLPDQPIGREALNKARKA
jgi:AcrR family transcriptional regulator